MLSPTTLQLWWWSGQTIRIFPFFTRPISVVVTVTGIWAASERGRTKRARDFTEKDSTKHRPPIIVSFSFTGTDKNERTSKFFIGTGSKKNIHYQHLYCLQTLDFLLKLGTQNDWLFGKMMETPTNDVVDVGGRKLNLRFIYGTRRCTSHAHRGEDGDEEEAVVG